jgi:6-pyruvoyltetrahydropterin/6-carboxytetrahydropterin synthase
VIIQRTAKFEAAHYLTGVPEDHPCSQMHGHSYVAKISVQGEVDEDSGMVIDFAVLRACIQVVTDQLDHTTLNIVPGLENPTAENLAIWFWDELILPKAVTCVGLSIAETDNNVVLYYGPPPALTARIAGKV